jgi:hypothetical protein
MGRPIKKKFFGNLNLPNYAHVNTDSGIGGESISSTITVTNTGTNYSNGAVVTFSAPSLPTGVTATGTPTFTTDGANRFGITGVTLSGAGIGYTGTATITVTTATAVTAASTGNSGLTATNTFTVASVTGIALGMIIAGASTGAAGRVTAVDPILNRITSSVNNNATWSNASNLTFNDYGTGARFITTLTSTTQNALNVTAYIPAKNGGASAKLSDIVKQEASQRYLVKNTDGIGQCKLVASDTPTAGQMNLIATDTNGSTYWVTKLTARRCILTRRTMSTAYLFATNGSAGWTIASASTGVVSIASV